MFILWLVGAVLGLYAAIGLGVFNGLSVLALIIVTIATVVTYKRERN